MGKNIVFGSKVLNSLAFLYDTLPWVGIFMEKDKEIKIYGLSFSIHHCYLYPGQRGKTSTFFSSILNVNILDLINISILIFATKQLHTVDCMCKMSSSVRFPIWIFSKPLTINFLIKNGKKISENSVDHDFHQC